MHRSVFAPGARRRLRQELHAIAPSPAAALLIGAMLLCVAAGVAFVIERLLP